MVFKLYLKNNMQYEFELDNCVSNSWYTADDFSSIWLDDYTIFGDRISLKNYYHGLEDYTLILNIKVNSKEEITHTLKTLYPELCV